MVKKYLYILLNLRKKPVVQNMVMVGGITLFLKVLGFYKEMLVAASFGLSEILDTFFIASLIPVFISNVFLGSFNNVFIPNYIAEEKSGGNIAAFQGMALTVTALVSLFFMLIAYLGTDVYVYELYPGHTPEYYQLIKTQFNYLLPCIVIWGFSALLIGLLNINNEFRYTSISGIFIPIVIIFLILFMSGTLGSRLLAMGTLMGSALTLLFLLVLAIQKNILKFGKPDFRNPNARLMLKQVPPKVFSGLATGMNSVVDKFFGAQLIVGSISALSYAGKLPAFISGLLVISISTVLLPHFSKSILDNRERTFHNLFKMLRLVFFGTISVVIIGVILSEPLIQLFFERKEFTSEDTAIVSTIQQAFLLYLPFSITGMIMVNFLTSINKNAIMAYIATIAMVLNVILDYILMQYYGVLGIAICTTIVIMIKNTIMFLYIYKLHNKERDARRVNNTE
ncbi:MAG TPA: lipid II flippase MurJ [Eudoraea sp.]|nr:lipid II flippase MurJ [Eudoraea sp.]